MGWAWLWLRENMAALLLKHLHTKRDVDQAIKRTEDKVLVLRFGQEDDSESMKLDDILVKNQELVSNMAEVYVVDHREVPVYVQYFDITIVPATVFFYNGQHIKVDWGTADHSKFIGSFRSSQDFIDVVEVIYRGAVKGKVIVNSPINKDSIPKYSLLYNDI